MRKIILTFAFICLAGITLAQEKHNSMYLEIGGNAVLYSINYDRTFTISKKLRIAPRLGFTYLPISQNVCRNFGNIRIPVEVNVLWSNKESPKHFLEGGLGVSFIQIQTRKTNQQSGIVTQGNVFGNVSTVRLGYRYQRPKGGFMLRAGLLVPVTQDDFSYSIMGDDIFYRLFPGLSLGYTF